MAVRPLVTTGVALLSAGALVAGTPGLFVPRDEVTVASSAAEAPVHRTLTAEQIQLVGVSLDGLLQAFNDGYGAQYYAGNISVPTAGYVADEDNYLVDPTEDTPPETELFGADGKPIYVKTADGKYERATVKDMGKDVQFYDEAHNVAKENVPDLGNCSLTGAMCHDGFTGLAYYLSDNILPLDIVDNIFFEAGATEFAYLGSVIGTSIVDAFDPTQRLQLSKRMDEFFAGGAAYVAYSIINDNLPDGAAGEWAKRLNATFYVDGITGVVDFMVETVKTLIAQPEPEETNKFSLLSTQEETEAKSDIASGISSTSLPSVSKLLSLPTNVESPFKKLEAPAESKLVTTLGFKTEDATVDAPADDSAEAATPVVEVSKPETPEVKAPKLPELKLPEVKLPEIKLPEREIVDVDADAEEVAASTEPDTETKPGTESKPGTGTSLIRDSLMAKPERKSTERKQSAGEKFIEKAAENLKKAFKATPSTKAGADAHEKTKGANANTDADSGDNDKDKKDDK